MKTSDLSVLNPARLLRIYYAATLLFVVLDYFLHINVRLAFLEAWPEMRHAVKAGILAMVRTAGGAS